MKILCPECSSAYDIPIPLLGAGRRMRCANCGHIWLQTPVQERAYGYNAPETDHDDIDPIPMSVHPLEPVPDSDDDDDDRERTPGFLSDVNWSMLGRMVGGFVLAWVLVYTILYGLLAIGSLPSSLNPLARAVGLHAGASAAGLEVKDVTAASNGNTTLVTGTLYNGTLHPLVIPMVELTPVMADGGHGDSKEIKPEQDTLAPHETIGFKADMGVKLDAGAGVRVRLLAY